MKNLISLNKYFWKYRLRLGLGVIFIFLSNLFAVMSPEVVRYAIDYTISQVKFASLLNGFALSGSFGSTLTKSIVAFSVIIFAFALLRGLFLFFMRQTLIVMSRHIEFDQKNELYNHYQQLDQSFYKENNTGDLMSRITEDVSRVRNYTGPAIMYIINTVILFFMVAYTMYRVNGELTLYALAPLPVLAVCIFFVNSIIERRSEAIQSQLSALTTAAQETYSGIRVIKAYVQEQMAEKYFNDESIEYKKRQLKLARVESFFFPTIFMLVGFSTLSVVFVGGSKVMNGQITPGNIAEFFMYINMLTWPIASMGWVMALIQRASASQKRLDEFLSIQTKIINPNTNKHLIKGGVEFHNVSFTYTNTGITALNNISFNLKVGEKMAVIGRTGAGKTTIANLFTRVFDVSEGSILLDGIDIRSINLHELREQVGVVPQDVLLFSDTVTNNISFGNDVVDEKLAVEFATRASVDEEILRLQHGYDTMVGERGVMLSGGQKQRISIARALIKNPSVLVLDDCLSAVDARTEHKILEQFNEVLKEKTAIVITHRIFTLIQFNKIIVLDKGKIAEEGTHDQLLSRKGLYYQLFELQQSEEKN
ncbi:ABC transporter [Bacteroidota bacterium]|nr:ABC transporter [Bacteroidota bacterium]